MPSLLVYRQNICLSSFISVTIRTTRNCQLKKQQLGRVSPQLLAQQVSPCSVTAHWYFQSLSRTLNLHLRSFLVYEYCSTHFISIVKNVSGNQKTSPSFSCSVSQQSIIHHKKKEEKRVTCVLNLPGASSTWCHLILTEENTNLQPNLHSPCFHHILHLPALG